MGDNMGDDLVTNFDLNRDPLVDDSSPPSPSPPPPTPPSRGGIEDRFRQLEAVSARVRQPPPSRRITNNQGLPLLSVIEPINQGGNGADGGGGIEERVAGEGLRNRKRDISHLTKALETELNAEKNDNGGAADGDGNNGSFFDCNICLDMAKDPVLTCCGHLFCWACFYHVPYVDSVSKECPVCKGEVTDSNITPIYGNGNNSEVLELESGVRIPPRPHASRVESVRQQSFNRGISQIPVADALRRIRIGLGLIEENPPQDLNSVAPTSENNSSNLRSSEAAASREARRFSRVLSESTVSLSSVSSALNSAGMFVEDLESYISDGHVRTEARLQPAYQETITTVGSTTVVLQSEPQGTIGTTVLHLGTVATNGSVEIDLTIARPASSSSRRRRGVSRTLNLEGEASLEGRRRRLR